ncbi:hypothetical protein [Pseudomonas qingdaonensis]|uniref:hypothetical protein n=1 Tax=Pseudomonas qingdaonensis TaxID=2056231 RepID=UPI00243121FE|nr:hypothetical protein [Pseudomonas qingdaonensis]
MPDIKVTTTKGFINGSTYVKRDREITVDELRARDLLRNGLIKDYREKSAPAPENKMAPDPGNKDQKAPLPLVEARVLNLKQEGHGKWIILGEDEKQVGDFVGNKADAQKELDRLFAEAKPPAQE